MSQQRKKSSKTRNRKRRRANSRDVTAVSEVAGSDTGGWKSRKKRALNRSQSIIQFFWRTEKNSLKGNFPSIILQVRLTAMKKSLSLIASLLVLIFATTDASAEKHTSGSSHLGKGYRIWTDRYSKRQIEAKLIKKLGDESSVQLLLRRGTAVWIETSRLVEDDARYVAAWEDKAVKLQAKTVATRRDNYEWVETWGEMTSEGFVGGGSAGEGIWRERMVGVEIDNRGTGGLFVVEVFWFGFPLNEKSKRVICQMATRTIRMEDVSRLGKWSAGISSTYDYLDETCIYLTSDPDYTNFKGLYVRTVKGYGYAGWAVRVSDGNGIVLDEKGSQPPFLDYLEEIPVPQLKKPKG